MVPACCTLEPLVALRASDCERLRRLVADGTVPARLLPLDLAVTLNPKASLALRQDGEIVAWVSTTEPEPGVLVYDQMCALPPHDRLGHGMQLVALALRAHLTDPALAEACPRGRFYFATSNAGMIRMVERRFRPFLDHQAIRRTSRCRFPETRSAEHGA
jgi:hypothetical protein